MSDGAFVSCPRHTRTAPLGASGAAEEVIAVAPETMRCVACDGVMALTAEQCPHCGYSYCVTGGHDSATPPAPAVPPPKTQAALLCVVCEGVVSPKALACPHCGHPFGMGHEAQVATRRLRFTTVALAVMGYLCGGAIAAPGLLVALAGSVLAGLLVMCPGVALMILTTLMLHVARLGGNQLLQRPALPHRRTPRTRRRSERR